MFPLSVCDINLNLIFITNSSKHLLVIPLLFLTALIQAQPIDYCAYFHLEVSSLEEDGQVTKSYSPEPDTSHADSISVFIKQHQNRFSYLLWNKLGDLGVAADLYPDTIAMDSLFCDLLRRNQLFIFYLNNLLPGYMRPRGIIPDTFSVAEMMLVASRFFYCLEIQESDTVVISHICVSIKEPESIPFPRDMTLLEAFAFEGIFYSLLKEEKPRFDANFKRYVNESTDRYKDEVSGLDALLVRVRHECFALMKDDEDLKYSLLNYYQANRNNLNFTITGSNK
jgi:hypothetical protein